MNRLKKGVAMKLEFPGAVPEIPVRDINEAAAYYENNLGFRVDWGGHSSPGAWAARHSAESPLLQTVFRRGRAASLPNAKGDAR